MLNFNDSLLLSKNKSFGCYRSERYKLLYVATPKVACTSLKWWFASLEGYEQILREISDSSQPGPDLIIHDNLPKVAPNIAALTPEMVFEALTSDEYFRFAVVRNPYKRIFSAWQSKLLLRESVHIAPYLKSDFLYYPLEGPEDIAKAFEAFLEHLFLSEAPSYRDVHWTPQANLLRPHLIHYSKLVQIENPEELSQALMERIGGKVPDPFSGQHSNQSLIPYLPEMVSARSAELIRLLYALDFETFGYSMEPPEGKETFSSGQFKVVIKAIAFIRGRHQRFGECNVKIGNLQQAIAERDLKINSHALELSRLYRSKSWRITGPARFLRRSLAGNFIIPCVLLFRASLRRLYAFFGHLT